MNRSIEDALRRATRTFFQGAVGVLMLTAIGPLNEFVTGVVSNGGQQAEIDLNIWRNIALAAFAGGITALISFIQNALEDNTALPTMLKPTDRAAGDAVLKDPPA